VDRHIPRELSFRAHSNWVNNCRYQEVNFRTFSAYWEWEMYVHKHPISTEIGNLHRATPFPLFGDGGWKLLFLCQQQKFTRIKGIVYLDTQLFTKLTWRQAPPLLFRDASSDTIQGNSNVTPDINNCNEV